MAKATTTQTTRPTTEQDAAPKEITNAIQHIEIVVPNAPKARKFFEKQFGWKFETFNMGPAGDYHMFRTPGGCGGGILEPQPGQAIATTPYISVDNCDATLKSCQKAGATIMMPVTEVPGQGRFFIFSYEGSPPIGCWQSTPSEANGRK